MVHTYNFVLSEGRLNIHTRFLLHMLHKQEVFRSTVHLTLKIYNF